jgi:tetratricopeptide (TPR) repeat protein
MWFMIVVLFLLVSHPLAASEEVFQKGMTFFRQGRYFDALEAFESIRQSPQFRDKADFAIATSLVRLNLPNVGISVFGSIVRKGPRSPLFRASVEEIAQIYEKRSAGRAITYEMFRENFPTIVMPTKSRGFYHYFLALRELEKKNLMGARRQFLRVPPNGFFFSRAQYLLGVISASQSRRSEALNFFSRSLGSSPADFRDLPLMGMGRIYYEMKDYRRALSFYSQVSRNSVHWPQSILEGGVAFFQMQRHNNTLGNMLSVLSPFFEHRFFPEAYIVNAITFLRLCHYEEVQIQIRLFRSRYQPTLNAFRDIVSRYRQQPETFFSYLDSQGRNLDKSGGTDQALNELRRSGVFLEGRRILSDLNREEALVNRLAQRVRANSLPTRLRASLRNIRLLTARQVGEEMLSHIVLLGRHLQNLASTASLILFDLEAGKTDALRARYQEQGVASSQEELWGEGMRPLVLTQEIEYWRVKQEWWADEIGSIVSQVSSRCGGTE